MRWSIASFMVQAGVVDRDQNVARSTDQGISAISRSKLLVMVTYRYAGLQEAEAKLILVELMRLLPRVDVQELWASICRLRLPVECLIGRSLNDGVNMSWEVGWGCDDA